MTDLRYLPANVSKLSGERPPAGRTRVRCSVLLGDLNIVAIR